MTYNIPYNIKKSSNSIKELFCSLGGTKTIIHSISITGIPLRNKFVDILKYTHGEWLIISPVVFHFNRDFAIVIGRINKKTKHHILYEIILKHCQRGKFSAFWLHRHISDSLHGIDKGIDQISDLAILYPKLNLNHSHN